MSFERKMKNIAYIASMFGTYVCAAIRTFVKTSVGYLSFV